MNEFDFRLDDLSALFSPRSIAVVGASSSPQKIGGIPIDYALRFGFGGALHAVNPTASEVQGLRAHASLQAIGEPVDLAILAVPAAAVHGAIEDAIAAKARSVVLFSAGFAEIGGEGIRAQERLRQRVREAGLRLVGPNCLGIMNIRRNTYATFAPVAGAIRVKAGRIGLVSQSGAFGVYAYALAHARGVGFSTWVTTGNEAEVQLADCLAWLAQDDETDVIMAYLEGCRDGPRLRAALAMAQERGKPVIMVKIGSTELGAQAAASHTAALAGDDAVYDAVLRRYGVIRARTVREFFDLAHSAAVAGRPRGRRIGLFTVSGGVGAMMADDAASNGMEVPSLTDAAQAQLREWVPFAAPRNPVDITAQVTNDMSLLERSARVMLEDQGFDSWMGFLAAAGASDTSWPILRQLVESLRAAFPDTVLALSTLLSPQRRAELEAMHCLVFEDPSEGIRTLAALAGRPGFEERAGNAVTDPADTIALPAGTLSEPAALKLLAQAGIPVVPHHLARSAKEAADAARQLDCAVAVKVVSADIPHKSDVGGVMLGLEGTDAVRAAFEKTQANALAARPDARLEGALVAGMVHDGVECIAGVRRDPVFGPVIMFGLGGIHVETLRDVSLRVLPVTREDALCMVRELRAFPILAGARGRPVADIGAIADALCALARFALAAGDTLDSVEINPLIARPHGEGGCVAVDALIAGRAQTTKESHP